GPSRVISGDSPVQEPGEPRSRSTGAARLYRSSRLWRDRHTRRPSYGELVTNCCGMTSVKRDLSDDGPRPGGARWRLGLPGAAPQQHYRQRPRHDLQVLADGLLADVFEIVAYLASHVVDRGVVPLIDLRPARDTGADALTPLVAFDLLPQVDKD